MTLISPAERARLKKLRERTGEIRREIRDDEIRRFAGGLQPEKLRVAARRLQAAGVRPTDFTEPGDMLRGLLGRLAPSGREKGRGLERATAVPRRGSR